LNAIPNQISDLAFAGTYAHDEFEMHRVARPGERAPLSIAMDRTVLFDPETDLAISYGVNQPEAWGA
jgi:hypothetical protein